MRRGTALTLIAASLLASSARSEERRRPGRFQVGPVHLTPRLELKNLGVDTNVFNASENAVQDTSVTFSPTVDLALPLRRRLRLTGTTWVDLGYFGSRESERSADFGGSGRVELDFWRLMLFGGGSTAHARQRFTLELDHRLRRRERDLFGGVQARVLRKLDAVAQVRRRTLFFDDAEVDGFSVAQRLDRISVVQRGELRYDLTRKTVLVASVERIHDDFVSQVESGPADVRSYRYMGGFELQPKALVKGALRVGRRRLPAGETQAATPYEGTALDVELAVPVRHWLRVQATVTRDLNYSLDPFDRRADRIRNTYQWTRYGLQVDVPLPYDLMATAAVGRQGADFVLPYTIGAATVDRRDALWTFRTSVLRRFHDALWLGVNVAWSERRSNVPGYSYEGLRYGLQAAVRP